MEKIGYLLFTTASVSVFLIYNSPLCSQSMLNSIFLWKTTGCLSVIQSRLFSVIFVVSVPSQVISHSSYTELE